MPYLTDLIMMMDQMITQMLQYSLQIYLFNQPQWLVYFPEQQPYQPLTIELKHTNYVTLNYSKDGQTLT
jgi:hypothetical protein